MSMHAAIASADELREGMQVLTDCADWALVTHCDWFASEATPIRIVYVLRHPDGTFDQYAVTPEVTIVMAWNEEERLEESTMAIRPNYWHESYPCPHNEMAYNATETWCETCGATLNEGGQES